MTSKLSLAAFTAACVASLVHAAAPAADVQPVTVDNFVRAETDLYLGNSVKEAGGVGKLNHSRTPADVDKQTVIRMNRDTLYSFGVFDLDASPVTITLPDAGSRFRSMQVINQDHYVVGDVMYRAGAYTYDRAKVGTRYVFFAIRTFVDPNNANDVKQAHALQDTTRASQSKPGTFEVPKWDPASQKKVRDALLVLGSSGTEYKTAFGTKQQVEPISHLIGTAVGWGGNPQSAAIYQGEPLSKNDGKTVHRVVVKDVPVDGFWSVSVYNAEGYFQKNPLNAYSLNNVTAKKGADGSYAIQFGGCDGKVSNCLPITPGWNYAVRLYRPRAQIVNGTWAFPKPEPVTP